MIEKRKEAKLRSEAGGVDPEVEQARTEYWSLHSEVRRICKRDKRRQVNEKISVTETQIHKNDGQSERIAYKSIKELNGSVKKRKEVPVKDHYGN